MRRVDVRTAYNEAASGALLLDVREPDEWAAGHAPGAELVPLQQVPSANLDTRTPILTICRSGARSAQAAAFLSARGHDVANVEGGMNAWSSAGLPVAATHGRTPAVA